MYRLYFDTCILNDFFTLIKYESGEKVRAKDVKTPTLRWTPEYVALYYILNLDDQWELEFGTSEITLQEIRKFQPYEEIAQEKKIFLEQLYQKLSQNWQPASKPVSQELVERIDQLFGPGYDSKHICHAIQNEWNFFITTDFRTILDNQDSILQLENLVLRELDYQGRLFPNATWEPIAESYKIKIRSPLQFLEENLIALPTLIRTLHGSWTDLDDFINRFGFGLDQLKS